MSKKQTITEQASITDEYVLLAYDQLIPSPDNVRQDVGDVTELAASIYQNGLQQAIRVQPVNDDGVYVIIAGHRRHAALGRLIDAGMWSGPIATMVSTRVLEDHDRVAAMLVENLQRTDLNPVEEAFAFQRLTKEFGYKQAELASKIGRSASYVSDRLALLKLPDVALDLVRIGRIRLDLAVQLTKVGDDERIAKLCVKDGVGLSSAAIDSETKAVTAAKLQKRMLEELSALNIEVALKPKPWAWTTLAEITDPKQFGELASFPKSAIAYMNASPWRGEVTVIIARPETEAEKAKKEKAAKAEQTEREAQLAAERAARFEKERASMSDAQRAWTDRCAELQVEYEAEMLAYTGAVDSARRTWVDQLAAKDAARFAMLDVVGQAWSPGIARFFELELIPGADVDDAVAEFCMESGSNLVKVVAYVLGIEDDNDDQHPSAAVASRNAFVARQKLVEPKLVLPPAPDNPDADELEDGEAAARAEALAAQDAYEGGDLGDDD
jgi:ParB family chromosome partitioning protein